MCIVACTRACVDTRPRTIPPIAYGISAFWHLTRHTSSLRLRSSYRAHRGDTFRIEWVEMSLLLLCKTSCFHTWTCHHYVMHLNRPPTGYSTRTHGQHGDIAILWDELELSVGSCYAVRIWFVEWYVDAHSLLLNACTM